MRGILNCFSLISCLGISTMAAVEAAESPYAYPPAPHDAQQIAYQSWLVVRGMHVRNVLTRRNGDQVAVLINQQPGRAPSINTLESYISNDPQDTEVESRQIAIFRSGKLRGSGVLMTSYRDGNKAPQLLLWLPSLRKVRRINAPGQEDFWSGSNFTYGEVFLRRPEHEQHELLETTVLDGCLQALQIAEQERSRLVRNLPEGSCEANGRAVYRLKSSSRFRDWWYDYRITDIDSRTFAPYRSTYYKQGQAIKEIYAHWQPIEAGDPRMQYPVYVYAHSLDSGAQSQLLIPRATLAWNQDIPAKFWSEKTLRKIKR